MILEVESEWRETGIPCPACETMTYSDGIHRPTCGNEGCLRELTDEEIWTWLITIHDKPESIHQGVVGMLAGLRIKTSPFIEQGWVIVSQADWERAYGKNEKVQP